MSTVQPIRAGGPLGARERTSAVWSIRHEIDEILEYFHDELDEWMSGSEHHDVVLGDAGANSSERFNARRARAPGRHQRPRYASYSTSRSPGRTVLAGDAAVTGR